AGCDPTGGWSVPVGGARACVVAWTELAQSWCDRPCPVRVGVPADFRVAAVQSSDVHAMALTLQPSEQGAKPRGDPVGFYPLRLDPPAAECGQCAGRLARG